MSGIGRVIKRYYPYWEEPHDNGREWISCLCPFHGESRPSASVSYDLDAFYCHACGVGGDAVAIIRHEEGVGYAQAFAIAEGLSVGCDKKVQRKPAGKSRRRVFGGPGDSPGDQVRLGIRDRRAPWT